MPPPSPTSEPPAGGLFDGVLARGRIRDAVDDLAWLQALLDVEAALARAGAHAGLIPPADAEAIAAACRAEDFDVRDLGVAAGAGGNPVIPLVRELTSRVGGSAGGHVHRGATSQDVLDSAAMLVAHRALGVLLDDLDAVAGEAAALAEQHRGTLMAGRTLLQQALPVTFGLKAAVWLVGVDEASARLSRVRHERLAVQLGGAVGTLASVHPAGPQVSRHCAAELGLVEPVLPWHTIRNRVAELAGALGETAGILGKIARDVTLLAQTEVAEVAEELAGSGGSSTLPHKRNPVAAVSAAACAAQAPGLVATLLAAMPQEHERAAGAWHAEWRPLTELLRTTGSAAAWLRLCLTHLRVDTGRMRENLEATGGLLLAEQVTTALAPSLGRLAAHDLVGRACEEAIDTGAPLAAVLARVPEIAEHIDADGIARLLEPADGVGSADALIDRALSAHHEREREWE